MIPKKSCSGRNVPSYLGRRCGEAASFEDEGWSGEYTLRRRNSSGFDQVGSDEEFRTHFLPGVPITKNGYLYIYVSNETPNVDVFFDNAQVTHVRGPLLEETHYYPFGLTMAGISSKAAGKLENKVRFNGYEQQSKEFSDGSGLEWYDYKHRYYDNQIGRFFVQDGLAHEYVYYTPYQFAGNEVPNAIDLDGLEPYRPNAPRYAQGNFQRNVSSYRQTNSYVPREAASYRTSARYIPNQAAGSAAIPANIYEPSTLGSGQQHTGPFVTRGNSMGKTAVAMTEMVDDLKGQIERVSQTTDKLFGNTSMKSASAWSVQWKSKEAEAAFNKLESAYQSNVDAINQKYQLTAAPGAGASQADWNKWLSDNKEIASQRMGALALLGPSPMQLIINSVGNSSDFKKVETKIIPLPEIRSSQ